MKAVLMLCAVLALSACNRNASAGRPSAPSPPPSPLDQVPDAVAPPSSIKPSFRCPTAPVEGEPRIVADEPLTEIQQLICAEPELAQLDHQVIEAYLAARSWREVNRPRLVASQRRWVEGRDTCLKAAIPRDCVAEADNTRLAELHLQDPGTAVPTPIEFACEGQQGPFTAAFYSRFEPNFAVLGWGRQQAIVFAQPTTTGLKYGRTGVSFWERDGQAAVDFYGRRLRCAIPADGAPFRQASAAASAAQ